MSAVFVCTIRCWIVTLYTCCSSCFRFRTKCYATCDISICIFTQCHCIFFCCFSITANCHRAFTRSSCKVFTTFSTRIVVFITTTNSNGLYTTCCCTKANSCCIFLTSRCSPADTNTALSSYSRFTTYCYRTISTYRISTCTSTWTKCSSASTICYSLSTKCCTGNTKSLCIATNSQTIITCCLSFNTDCNCIIIIRQYFLTNSDHTRSTFSFTICLRTITNCKCKNIIYLTCSRINCVITTSNSLQCCTIVTCYTTNSNGFTCTSNYFCTNTNAIFTSSCILTTYGYIAFTICSVFITCSKGTGTINCILTTKSTCLSSSCRNSIRRTNC